MFLKTFLIRGTKYFLKLYLSGIILLQTIRIYQILLVALLFSTTSSFAGVQGDVNNDGVIDLAEAIYSLQVSAGFHPDVSPSCVLRGKGSWVSGINYVECDVVLQDEVHYICTEEHTSTAVFLNDISKWRQLALQGEPGPVGGNDAQLIYNNNGQAAGTTITYNQNTEKLNMRGVRITNLASPVNSEDAATKSYIDDKLATLPVLKNIQRGEKITPQNEFSGNYLISIEPVNQNQSYLLVSCSFTAATSSNCSSTIRFDDNDNETIQVYYSSDNARPKLINWQVVEFN